ncbi:MAG TPA: preprotein translocase subunit SecA [Candidatus Paceibacterota bacterium]|nr:preprotein translocase subunit SecA [Candidatus Paceibacterota bacterium]
MLDSLKRIFSGDQLKPLREKVAEINALEEDAKKLSDEELRESSHMFRNRLSAGETLDDILPEAFARVREAARRTLGQRPFDVQLMGGIVLHKGAVAEMMTGEGKTLAAVAPVYLNALENKGAHVVTVNEYLARRDAVWMGRIYRALGLSVACLVPNAAFSYDPEWKIPEGMEKLPDKEEQTTGNFMVQQEFLKPVSRRDAYLADVTYGTNHEFGFDYLRDNLAYALPMRVQREHHFAVIDEVDSILIDESRTPLIIAAPDEQSSEYYKTFARIARDLAKDDDYTVDEKLKQATITENGIGKVEKVIGVSNLYAPEHIRLVHYLEESLRAKALFTRDKDYVVRNGEVIIVDEFTGRMLMGRRYQGGLHQAIEAKEGVFVKEESRTYAKISVQNYFRMYKKISGMTGTAQTSAEEFHKVYKLDVVSIPTNNPFIRDDRNDLIYKNYAAKYRAVIEDVRERHKKGQPILLGTASIEKNELMSALLSNAAIPHETLNAKNNEREGAIIAQAGRSGAVTVATNVAGRGVDILLGGNPPDPKEAEKVRALGGLHVIGTERHEARRIDNQLRGRSGRQGDQGSSQFFLSLEDDLLRIFGGDRIKNMMERFQLPEDEPLQFGFLSKVVSEAQAKVEGANFDSRKHLLEYDDVLNKQRASVYRRRFEILSAMNKEALASIIFEATSSHLDALIMQPIPDGGEALDLKKIFTEAGILKSQILDLKSQNPISGENRDPGQESNANTPDEQDEAYYRELLVKRSDEIAANPMAMNRLLGILDMLWMTHLEDLEALSEAVGLRAYGQRDPLVEYRQEAHQLFKSFWNNFNGWVFVNLHKLSAEGQSQPQQQRAAPAPALGKVGRNDPCPCGSGKKYKFCHLNRTRPIK